MEKWIQRHQPAKGRRRRSRIQPMHAELSCLVFEIPAFARRNRAGGKKAYQLAVQTRREVLLVFRMEKWIQRHQPAKGRRRRSRIEPMHAEFSRLFLQRRVDVLGDYFDFNARPTGLVHASAQFLGDVTAWIPGLKIEVRRGAHFDRREIAWRQLSCELGSGRYKGNDATFLFCKRRELAPQGG